MTIYLCPRCRIQWSTAIAAVRCCNPALAADIGECAMRVHGDELWRMRAIGNRLRREESGRVRRVTE